MGCGEGQALIETRMRHLLDTVKRGLGTEALLVELDAEDKRRKALAAELAGLADLDRVASWNGAQIVEPLAADAQDVRRLLTKHVPQARQMLRKLLDGRLLCEPIVDESGRRGYRVRGTGTYGRLLGRTSCPERSPP